MCIGQKTSHVAVYYALLNNSLNYDHVVVDRVMGIKDHNLDDYSNLTSKAAIGRP